MGVLSTFKEALSQGRNLRDIKLDSEEEINFSNTLYLLTQKPVLYVCNVDDETIRRGGNEYVEKVKEVVGESQMIMLSVQTEAEIAELDNEEDRQQFLSDLGLNHSGADLLIKSAYSLLKLRTFLTAGKDEVRAWTFRDGWTAPKCAGVIHSDFERGFICAEIIKYDDFITHGGESACRSLGKVRNEGKEYLVQDGDIIHFMFNV